MSQGDGNKLRLMVVDDEPDNLDLLYRTFRRDFDVLKADSGRKALQILDREGEMAIIISDQRMPGMNGTEFLSKTVDRFPETIRIVLTGYTDVEDLVGAINSGKVFKYITKPWNPDELKTVVLQAAETYQVLKQRTRELRRALRRESLFNAVMTAIRESLDYQNMLQTIVETIGPAFAANCCILRVVEGVGGVVAKEYRLAPNSFIYAAVAEPGDLLQGGDREIASSFVEESLVPVVLESRQTQSAPGSINGKDYTQLVVPLTYQQDFLAILSLYQYDNVNPWSPEDIELIEEVAEQAAIAISQAKLYQRIQEQTQQMRSELAVARQIQSNLLRQSWPPLEGVKVQACCYPAREVGGDFFEVYVHSQDEIWLAVGDVSGKGVPAALYMASAISVLRRELSQEVQPEPDVVMRNLNSILSEDLISNNCFITMALARYRPSTGQLSYANAGHIYPLVWSPKMVADQLAASEPVTAIEPIYLQVRGVPLGILPVWQAPAGNLTLTSGDALLLMSDGITEAQVNEGDGDASKETGTGSMLKQTGLWQLLIQEKTPLNLESLLTRIRADNQVQEDDQTILSLEVL